MRKTKAQNIARGPEYVTDPRLYTWELHLNEYLDFVRIHHRTPLVNPTDPDETRVSRWYGQQKHWHSKGNLSQTRVSRMDAAIPEWKVVKRHRPTWEVVFAQVIAFHRKHGRLPDLNSSNPKERFIANWIRRQKESRTSERANNQASRNAQLDAAIPNWRSDASDYVWGHKLNQAVDFHAANGRNPSYRTYDKKYKSILNWIALQNKNLRVGKLPTGRIAKLDTDLPDWREQM